ncbi:MAG: L-serine ammonia-lyase, iron-sulfur-dependent, subunit alpha, partial [Clostridia bacterium]
MFQGDTLQELVTLAGEDSISQVVCTQQALSDHVPESALRAQMAESLAVMRASVEEGMQPHLRSLSGMTGG